MYFYLAMVGFEYIYIYIYIYIYKQNQKSDIANYTFLIFFINFYRFHCVKNRFYIYYKLSFAFLVILVDTVRP